jgi:predicted amidohydrolase
MIAHHTRTAVTLLLLTLGACVSPQPPSQRATEVKVAVVHFGPKLGDVAENRTRLVALTEEAARNGAKIIVHTEMATSGYSFFSRAEIAKVAEPVPGPTTDAIGVIARRYQAYVAVGMPMADAATGSYFNVAALIGPDGRVLGVYRKRSNLLESAYNAEAFGPIPVFDTPYGRLGIVICADLLYSEMSRIAAVEGAQILLAPANVGTTVDFLKVRAYENDLAVLVANRYGSEGKGGKSTVFDQDSFAIPSPFPYDFSWGALSAIVLPGGKVPVMIEKPMDQIGYAVLPIGTTHAFPVQRRPELYGLMAQDTLEPYTVSQFGLPQTTSFAAAAIDPGSPSGDVEATAKIAITAAIEEARKQEHVLRLAVLPAGLFDQEDAALVQRFTALAQAENVDIVVPFARDTSTSSIPVSVFITSDPKLQPLIYRRTHRFQAEMIGTADHYLVVDRDYGRIAILQGPDLVAPESSVVMAKMGVDVVAVSADIADDRFINLLRSRSGDYLHIVEANRAGPEAIFLGGYKADPLEQIGEGRVIMQIDTADVRNKKEPRFIDMSPLLTSCGSQNC